MSKSSLEDLPPSYSESLSTPFPSSSAAAECVNTQVLPHVHKAILNQDPACILVIIPSNVSNLSPQSEGSSEKKQATPSSFPGEILVGFPITPTIIRLCGAQNTLEIWRRAVTVREFEAQLQKTLVSEGYSIIGHPSDTSQLSKSPNIAGSKNVDWKSPERTKLREHEARVEVSVKECA